MEEDSMRYCPNCGSGVREGAAFCPSCGASLANLGKGRAPGAEMPSDPSVTTNIILILVFLLLLVMSTVMADGEVDNAISFGSCVMSLSTAGVLAFFAVRPSSDHIDTVKMDLLKTVELFGVAVAYLVAAVLLGDEIAFLYMVFVFIFALMTALKIRKIDITSRSTGEKVLLALSILLAVFAGMEFCTLPSYLIYTIIQ